LSALNPELIRRTTPPRRYSLKVPVGSKDAVSAALASIPVAERLEFRPYKIQKGDTLAKVSARYHTSPQDLLDFNNITRGQFRAGRQIHVPVVVKAGQQSAGAKKPAAKPGAKPAPKPAPKPGAKPPQKK
jgi:membrane-bound lytic murein transglycosylase D